MEKAQKPELGKLALFYWMLFSAREYVICQIKDPLRKAIETGGRFSSIAKTLARVASKIPTFGKDNLTCHNSEILWLVGGEIIAHHHNPWREKLITSGLKMAVAEYAHDAYYAWFLDKMLIDLSLEIARGNWRPSNLQFPYPACWSGEDLPDIDTIRQKMREALAE